MSNILTSNNVLANQNECELYLWCVGAVTDPCTHCDGETFRPATTTAVLAVRRAPNVMHQLSMAPRHRISEKPATTRRAALTAPAYGQMWRVYYYAGGQTIAMRTHELDPIFYEHYTMLYYLHTDHLGSTSVTTCGHANCGTVGQVLSRQSYYPYGGVRQQVGTLPTRRTYTGQYADDTGLMFYNARYYAPVLGRFISADSIVPGAGNPQAFNRYMYVLGNPLKYTDPSGHDVMLVGGYSSNDFADPIAWREWIMTYKGWNAEQWDSYYEAWMNPRYSSAQSREYLMKHYGIYYYRWAKGDSVGTPVNLDAVASLARQMRGMNNITLIGHSKGASLVHTYMAMQAQNSAWASTYVKNFVSIKAPTNNPDIPFPLLGDRQLVQYIISLASGSRQPDFPSDRSNLVNIYGNEDLVSSNGYILGATNFMSNDDQNGSFCWGGFCAGDYSNHGNAPRFASHAFASLNVNFSTDNNSGRLSERFGGR